MPKKHKLIIEPDAKEMFHEHLRFLKRESHSAANRLVSSYRKSVARIADNPFQFPIADELDLPGIAPNTYRKCLFESRYKVLFRLEENIALIIAVIDTCMENVGALPFQLTIDS